MCRHRGNKLVWNDYPGEEVSGTCRQFTCKYHAWRYALNGDLTFVQQEGEFFDLDKGDYGLVPVRCEVWEGFIFVNFDNDAAPLRDYLGDFGEGPRGLPVPRDDRGLQLPRRRSTQLEAVHRRVHRVLPRADPAHEAGRRRRRPRSWPSSASRRWPTTSRATTRWCRRGAACRRRRTSTWSSPSSGSCTAACSDRGTARTSRASCPTSCRRPSTRAATRPGAPTRSSSSPTSRCCSGRRAGTSPTTTGRPRWTSTSSRPTSTSCRRRTSASGCPRSWPR